MLPLLFIIVAAVSVILYFIFNKLDTDFLTVFSFILAVISIVGFLVTGIISVFTPHAYNEPKEFTSSRQITAISNDESLYVLTTDNKYTYCVTYPTANGPVEERITVSTAKCEIVEEENCDVPRIEVYTQTSQTTKWHLGGKTKTEYVIYVPKGTVLY